MTPRPRFRAPIRALLLAVAGLSAWGCAAQARSGTPPEAPAAPADSASAHPGLDEARQRFARAFESGSEGTIRAMFAQGALIQSPPGSDRIGYTSVDDFARLAARLQARRVVLTVTGVHPQGNQVVETGTWQWTLGSRTTQTPYRVVWRTVGGAWKVHSLGWSQ